MPRVPSWHRPLTETQVQTVRVIGSYMIEHGQAPTHAELTKLLNLGARTVEGRICNLEIKQIVERTPYQMRGLKLSEKALKLFPEYRMGEHVDRRSA